MIIINQTNNDLGHSREKGYSDEEPDLVLYTTDSHGGEWLIDLIGTALWLVKLHQAEKNGSKKPANINIILLPIGNAKINPLTGFLIHVIKRLLIGLPDIIKNYLPWKFKQYAKQSLYNEIHSGKKVAFTAREYHHHIQSFFYGISKVHSPLFAFIRFIHFTLAEPSRKRRF